MRRSRNRNPILMPAALVVYAIVMGVISYPRYQESGNWKEFWLIIGGVIVAAVLLYFVTRKRNKLRDDFNKRQ